MKQSRQIGLASLAIVVGLLVGTALGEGAARAFSLATPLRPVFGNYVSDPNLPFRPRPFSRDTGRAEEFAYDYQHNSLGFRDVEHPLEKPAGTFRILGLGDSFTYGVGAAANEMYLARLEQRLAARTASHPRIEVIKAGIPRYFPEAERLLLEHDGKAFDPDLIVVGVLPNDVLDTYLGLGAVTTDSTGFLKSREASELGRFGTFLYQYSHLARLALRFYIDRRHQPHYDDLYHDGSFHEKDWKKMEVEYGRMAAIADSIGARLVLMHIPQGGPWNEESRYLPRRFSAWARNHGVYFLDVLPAMERADSVPPLYYPRDGHCTPAGYAVVADTLFEYLVNEHLVP